MKLIKFQAESLSWQISMDSKLEGFHSCTFSNYFKLPNNGQRGDILCQMMEISIHPLLHKWSRMKTEKMFFHQSYKAESSYTLLLLKIADKSFSGSRENLQPALFPIHHVSR